MGHITVDDFRDQDEWTCTSRFGWYRLTKNADGSWDTHTPTGPDTWEPDSHYDNLEDAIADLDLIPEY